MNEPGFELRPWRASDLNALVKHANDPEIAGNLRDAFPHPYTEEGGRMWLTMSSVDPFNFCIEVDGEAAGSIGFIPGEDIHRVSAEIGYWLGRKFWGRGIMTDAVRAATAWGFDTYGWRRIFAGVFAPNAASMRVLEKAGYTREAVLRNAIIKNGKILDQVQFAIVR